MFTLRVFLAGVMVVFLNLPVQGEFVPATGCIGCHGNSNTMTALGYAHFIVTGEEVRRQSGMPAACPDCHKGNPATTDREEAHRGMGRLLLARKQGLRAEPVKRNLPLSFGTNPASRIRYETMTGGRTKSDPSVAMVLYQDRGPDTLSQNFGMMKDTCGRCHPKQLEEFQQSTMGRNSRQSRYLAWDDPQHGPHNCGVWFTDAYRNLSGATTVPYSRNTAALNQRACNTCHAGCLDCHYEPSTTSSTDPRAGMHRFRRTPSPLSCYGGGRGSVCHAGPEDRRRGAGYFGGPFSYPEGLSGDIHREKGIGCLDCHASSKRDARIPHGMIERQGSCDRCHPEILKRHDMSGHKRLACESCHIREAGGYQATFWGPGILAGTPTPFYKYLAYYGVMNEPILIRDPGGRWIPVKPFPMAVMNQRSSATRTAGLYWRWPPDFPRRERTGDAYGYVGLSGGLPENNRALLWLQMDRLSHQMGKSRTCDSCHSAPDGRQTRQVSWEYSGEGAFPFTGSHTVVADSTGLAIRGMKAAEEIEVQPGFLLSSFAPWLFLPDRWIIPGNFALPPLQDRSRYERLKHDLPGLRREGITH